MRDGDARAILGGLLVLVAFAFGSEAQSATRTYPGVAPCDTTLQACIAGATSGDEIEIATAGPIDENLSVAKSLTLRPASGFAPVIGGGPTTRVLQLGNIGSAAANEAVVIEGLTFQAARIDGLIYQATGHSITIRANVFEFEIDHNNTAAMNLDYRVPGTLLIEGNQITSTGQGMRLWAILDGGSLAYRVERNVVTTSWPEYSNAGISFDLRGSGSYTIEAFSNVVYGVGGCNCGGNGGIVIDVVEAPQVDASLTNNTVDRSETSAPAVEVLVRDPGAVLALNLFNNSISNSAFGFDLDNFGEGTVTLVADANNSYRNGGDAFRNLAAAALTNFLPLYVDPLNGDYRLFDVSPLADAGVNAPAGGTSTFDAAGGDRILGGQIDVGALESHQTLCDPGFALCAIAGGGSDRLKTKASKTDLGPWEFLRIAPDDTWTARDNAGNVYGGMTSTVGKSGRKRSGDFDASSLDRLTEDIAVRVCGTPSCPVSFTKSPAVGIAVKSDGAAKLSFGTAFEAGGESGSRKVKGAFRSP
jgi:hypothetical protein